ncbi:MBL fold metallo-hydrolase [Plastoroseomonas arctica]|uniref:MBL fold metallo-hydrolase n=1 Tax=Plastoroseomonas arctica TaxID=1509237 RepID=A0AAF1KIT8_9PROT|nr:MBL fold metallo-hydrolase [Plastoroseomonas arctica]MBR0654450.1 MBL fold metallo-hydrolase [Plastoroseomonas arctica]
MPAFICTACGIQHAESDAPPASCAICADERQYVPPTGQGWTTLERLRRTHMATFRMEGALLGIGTAPAVGIGQRALLLRTPAGNVLWDCVSLIDDAMVQVINALGGLAAIAISHPHYYTTQVEWSRAFGGVPVHLHAADREWIMRPDPCIELWEGDAKPLLPGVTLIRAGGHYPGGTVLHWAEAKGALLTGDLLQVVADRAHVGFMWSYPNFIPLGAAPVRGIAARIAPYRYDAVYGAFWDRVILSGAEDAVARSVARHVDWVGRTETG